MTAEAGTSAHSGADARTTEVTEGASRRRIPGEEGVWVFVLGDMTIFALFFATFMFSRGKNSDAFARAHESLNVALGATNTVLLLTSSLLVALGIQRVLSNQHQRSPVLFGAALAGGLGFVGIKAVEWSHLLMEGKTLAGSDFYSYYFIFTGIHLVHVLLGIAVLTLLIVVNRRPQLSARQVVLCESGGIYWHMVDLLWVVLFALFYLVR
ncbi:cytochrome c oxidase subunit 3 [Mycobacterium sp.]|uniref:cytochrome c oxidase subunit 3 n=1 Tax=Mycobacterium sp. TaxID=1785 RepID=UPI003C72FC81